MGLVEKVKLISKQTGVRRGIEKAFIRLETEVDEIE